MLRPDLRVWFGGTAEELKTSLEDILLDAGIAEDLELHIDAFPDKM